MPPLPLVPEAVPLLCQLLYRGHGHALPRQPPPADARRALADGHAWPRRDVLAQLPRCHAGASRERVGVPGEPPALCEHPALDARGCAGGVYVSGHAVSTGAARGGPRQRRPRGRADRALHLGRRYARSLAGRGGVDGAVRDRARRRGAVGHRRQRAAVGEVAAAGDAGVQPPRGPLARRAGAPRLRRAGHHRSGAGRAQRRRGLRDAAASGAPVRVAAGADRRLRGVRRSRHQLRPRADDGAGQAGGAGAGVRAGGGPGRGFPRHIAALRGGAGGGERGPGAGAPPLRARRQRRLLGGAAGAWRGRGGRRHGGAGLGCDGRWRRRAGRPPVLVPVRRPSGHARVGRVLPGPFP